MTRGRRPPARTPSRRPRAAPAIGNDAPLEPWFWRDKPLDAMSSTEWEALCDGCGKCCLLKLEEDPGDPDAPQPGAVHYTRVACRLLDPETCRCGSYSLRQTLVSGCVALTAQTLPEIAPWMPKTCAYRRLFEGRDLPDWHPLRTGDPDSVHRAGASVRGRVIPEFEVDEDELWDHVIGDDAEI